MSDPLIRHAYRAASVTSNPIILAKIEAGLAREAMALAVYEGQKETFARHQASKALNKGCVQYLEQRREVMRKRREKVKVLLLNGMTRNQIAAILDAPMATIERDVAAVRKEMKPA